ncbi:MAG: PP2C family protein-serine/threonine phosphatase [Burkholderiales bacterium]
MNYSIAQDSRIGARRYNQDRLGCWATSDALLMVVADGMGGHLHGEVAAQLALETLAHAFQGEAKPKLADPDMFLFRSFARAHGAIVQEAQQRGLRETPRTVLVACVVQDGYAYWSHVGDSRLYFIRCGRVAMRTKDHSRVQQLIDKGQLREEAVPTHPERNILTRCLGSEHAPRLEPAASARLAKHDLILMCSDGLWGPLTERQLLDGLRAKDLPQAVFGLGALAEARAGAQCDNVSVLAMEWGEGEVAPSDEPFTLPFHELPTDVQDFTASEPDFMRMSDDDIEREIAEIKAALRKHSGTP